MAAEDSDHGGLGSLDGGPPGHVVDERHSPTAEEWSQQLVPQPPNLPTTTQATAQPATSRDVPFPAPSAAASLPVTTPQTAGQPKQADEMFCQSCGRAIKKQAVICVYCGVPVQGGVLSAGARPKSKTAAVLLAVFLTFWTWCYTYKRDAWKFWLNLVLSVVTLGIWAVTVAWLWAIIDVAVKPSEYYAQFPNYGVTTRAA